MRQPLSLVTLSLLVAAACAHGPPVQTDELPLKRVVVYRNGVGYFERAGSVDSEHIRFRVRPDAIGDFLATLAVVERGGSSVRAASFPLELGEANQTPVDPETPADGASLLPKLVTVMIELDGKKHDLAVGYIASQPVWKPTYRLVFSEEGVPALQAWGIVQNLSGEDWKDVRMSLVAGAPISFRAALQEPVTPTRPLITDAGEMIGSVPQSQTTLARRPRPAAPPPPSAAPSGESLMDSGMPQRRSMASKSRAPSAPMAESAGEAPDFYGDDAELEQGSAMPRNLALLASAEPTAGATRYDLPETVTVPDNTATMVLFLAQTVPGEAVHMFAPDPGVPDSSRHPFRVARFRNASRGLLERGPIAFFEARSFLGQGMLEPLAPEATATVPFAIDRGIAIESDRQWEQRGARLAQIEATRLIIEIDQVLQTTYRLRSGAEEESKVLVKHPRTAGMQLLNPPAGTEDNLGSGSALVPVVVGASAVLKVDEFRPQRTGADWFSEQAELAVKAYLADKRADPKIVEPLRRAWEIRGRLVKAMEERAKLVAERDILESGAEQTRSSLKAIERNRGNVADLLRTLSERLIQLDKKLAEANRRLVELELQVNEQQVRFTETLREVRLTAPLPREDGQGE